MLDGLIENKQDDEAVEEVDETSKLKEPETDTNEANELTTSDDKSDAKLDESDAKLDDSDEKEVKDSQEI